MPNKWHVYKEGKAGNKNKKNSAARLCFWTTWPSFDRQPIELFQYFPGLLSSLTRVSLG
jgi:hypothetical protein